jgi:uroporphyrinogen decarboxylase
MQQKRPQPREKTMTAQERVTTVLNGGIPDRVPYQDAFWATTIERWRTEGLPQNTSPDDYFGCEIAHIGGDYSLQLPIETLEKTDHHHIYRDENGATRKDLNTADGWTPGWLTFAINNRDDWHRFKKNAQYHPSRIPQHIQSAYQKARAKSQFVTFAAHACFHPTWQKIGMENMLMLLIEDPDFITDIYATHAQLIIDLYNNIKALGIAFDGARLADDLGYRNAPLISPTMYRDLVLPHHKRLCDHFAQDGLKTILHSDGDVRPLIPHFLDAGFSALHPLEVKANLNVQDLKLRYGNRLVLFGNIDARALAGSYEDIENEICNKVNIGKENGGYIFHTDHSVPNDVSFHNYQFACKMLQKYGQYA